MVATRRQRQRGEKGDANGTKEGGEAQSPRKGGGGDNTDPQKDTRNGTKSSKQQQQQQQQQQQGGLISRLNASLDGFLFKQIDIAPLVYFRIIFGSIMLWEVTRYLGSSKIRRYYIDPVVYFKYFGFSWMPGPLGGHRMYLFYSGMGVLYTLLILGLWYRVTSVLCFLGFFYWFNLDMSQHLNHFYLVSLISFLMMFMPANRNASLDVICKPQLRVATVPAWTLWMIVLQVGIAYFFGGIAKMNSDWLHGEPMRVWLLDDYPEGHVFTAWWAPYFFSWGGLVYDTVVVPMLLWKRTRMLAVVGTTFFHIMNDNIFQIGIFPWFMLFSTPLYFEPEWLRPVLKFEWIFGSKPGTTQKSLTNSPRGRLMIKWFFCTFMTWQCLMPFRHHLYPGNTAWTEEGHLYSWHMMLRDKFTDADFTVKYGVKGQTEEEVVDQDDFLTKRQQMRMAKRPEMILQFAHFLCEHYEEERGLRQVQVFVDNKVSLNGRKEQDCVDPTVDLCKAEHTMRPSPWILPLTVPLSDQSIDSLLNRIKKHNGIDYVGARVAKEFGEDGIFFGTVKEYFPDHTGPRKRAWNVLFDDGDEDIFNAKDLATALSLHQGNKDHDEVQNLKSEL